MLGCGREVGGVYGQLGGVEYCFGGSPDVGRRPLC